MARRQADKSSSGSGALRPLHRLFALEVVGGASAAAAYRTVYPKAAKATAETVGPALARRPDIAAFIDARRAPVLRKAELTADVKLETVLLELRRMLAVDPLDAWTDNQVMKRLEDIEPDLRRAIASMQVEERFEGEGDKRHLVGYLRKLTFHSKTAASEQLLRTLGAFRDKLQVDVAVKTHAELVLEAARRALGKKNGATAPEAQA